ncbi:hypothetical protein NLI96_g10441 [Meripilus lineatus]|uniref:UPF3 domain-containing protein n=1 Tax=Meripilus lineatus TaxID=2056292 RepID=A0AAD5Y9B0_9APHY|nr:hypothetical protein NLI96_g10441 [Physisporinus lineatus]
MSVAHILPCRTSSDAATSPKLDRAPGQDHSGERIDEIHAAKESLWAQWLVVPEADDEMVFRMSMSTSKPVPVPSQPESAITPRSRPRTKVRQPLGRLGVLTSAIASKAPRTVFTVISSPTSPFMPPSVQILTSGEPAKQVTPKPKSKEKERKPRSSHRSQVERLKTIVRRLPPNLPEDVFWQSVQPWVTEETVTWKVYYQGKFRKRINKENTPSRAYIAFRSEELLATFSREYDGHIFRDKAGNESVAVVEFAPFQKVPSEKKKVDGRMGTIEKDEDYISFMESLKDTQTKTFDADTLEALVASTQPAPAPTSTPLLEALKAEKSAQKDKEAIQRNHAHYKDPIVASGLAPPVGGSKKEDTRKRSSGAPPPSKATETQPSKKGGQSPSTGQSSSKPTPPSPAKSGRGHRDRQASKSVSITISTPTPVTSPDTTITASPTSQTTPLATPATTPAPAPRRTRPVLGLGSRQFEAALSGAGVAISTSDRKARRERERQASVAATGDQAKTQAKDEPKAVPPVARSVTQPTPTILQRDSQQQTQGPVRSSAETSSTTPAATQREDAPSERGGRGRNRRGRGRGGRGAS